MTIAAPPPSERAPGMAPRKAPHAWVAAATLLLASGCASWREPGERAAPSNGGMPEPSASVASTSTSTTTPSGPAAVDLEIDAPEALRALLDRHLDLARLARTTTGDAVSDVELRRIEVATPAQVRALLETEGYFAPNLRVERVTPGSSNDTTRAASARVHLQVEPGPQARIERLDFDVQGELERRAQDGDAASAELLAGLRSQWPLQPGRPFRNTEWSDAKNAMLARLRAQGYTAAAWSGTSAQVDADKHRVRLTLILDTGARYHVGELRIEGLTEHDTQTVRNLAGFEPGAPATEATLLDFQDRLLRTGLFDQASVVLDTDNADPAGTPVIVRVKEASMHQATLGLGISANTGPRVVLEHTHRRAFGNRATARNKLEVGRLRQAWDGELSSHAQPDLYRNLIGGTVERLVAEDDGDVVRSLRARVARVQETTTRERSTFVEIERAQRRTLLATTTIDAASLNFHGTWRRVDNVLLPTEGWSMTLQTGAGWARSSQADNSSSSLTLESGPYSRVLGRAGLWRPLPGNFYGQVRLEAAQVFAREAVAIPDTQLFRAGGDDSVRGYAYRSLGPVVDGSVAGGRVMSTASVEIARPVSAQLPSVWWAFFADAGQAAQRWNDLDPVWGAGIGVRWRSPVGPLRVDWAWGNAVRQGRLHLSVGVVF